MSLTEYGELVIGNLDEWGFKKIDGLMEDGRYIFLGVAPAVFAGGLNPVQMAKVILE